jgi:amidase
MAAFDVLTTNASDLQSLLDTGRITSVSIVQRYLDQIDRHNHAGVYLNALIDVAPRHVLLAQAIRLDNERTKGQVRSPLHGIPVVVKVNEDRNQKEFLAYVRYKDNILTHSQLGLSTTGGNWAFVGARCIENASVIQRLVDAGAIIIAKGNLTVSADSISKGYTNKTTGICGIKV